MEKARSSDISGQGASHELPTSEKICVVMCFMWLCCFYCILITNLSKRLTISQFSRSWRIQASSLPPPPPSRLSTASACACNQVHLNVRVVGRTESVRRKSRQALLRRRRVWGCAQLAVPSSFCGGFNRAVLERGLCHTSVVTCWSVPSPTVSRSEDVRWSKWKIKYVPYVWGRATCVFSLFDISNRLM